jgi:hypothetical protein
MVDKNEDWKKLAEEAAEEADPERFRKLIAQLNKVFERAERAMLLDLLRRN